MDVGILLRLMEADVGLTCVVSGDPEYPIEKGIALFKPCFSNFKGFVKQAKIFFQLCQVIQGFKGVGVTFS